MLKLLAAGSDADRSLRQRSEEALLEHSNDGLRTLVLAYKPLDAATHASWSEKYRYIFT